MAVWRKPVDLAGFMTRHEGTLPGLLGIRLEEVAADFARASMPVDDRHIQPAGILHGGASVVLAETLGSYCGVLALPEGQVVVGTEVSASHLAAVRHGDRVTATCRPLRIGRSQQVWDIRIERGDGRLTCVCRLTVATRDASAGA